MDMKNGIVYDFKKGKCEEDVKLYLYQDKAVQEKSLMK